MLIDYTYALGDKMAKLHKTRPGRYEYRMFVLYKGRDSLWYTKLNKDLAPSKFLKEAFAKYYDFAPNKRLAHATLKGAKAEADNFNALGSNPLLLGAN